LCLTLTAKDKRSSYGFISKSLMILDYLLGLVMILSVFPKKGWFGIKTKTPNGM
jgi:hypothetical protein